MPVGTVIQSYTEPVVYPSGRRRHLVRPFSPWQKLVEGRRIEKDLSVRELAASVSTGSSQISYTRIWNWLRHPLGYPPRQAYSETLNARFARALGLAPHKLAEAYEESLRHHHTGSSSKAASEALRAIRAVIANSDRTTWTTAQIVKLIDEIAPPS